MPVSAPGIDREILAAPSGAQVEKLAQKFRDNERKFKDDAATEIIERGGPMREGESSFLERRRRSVGERSESFKSL